MVLTEHWVRHRLNLSLPSWLPATVAASFVIIGAPVTVFFDDVELRQVEPAATLLPPSAVVAGGTPGCKSVNLMLADPPANAMWLAGQVIKLKTSASADCRQNQQEQQQIIAVEHQLLTPNGKVLSSGRSAQVPLGSTYSLQLPANASGGTLLNVTATVVTCCNATIIVARLHFRMLVNAPISPPVLPAAVVATPWSSNESNGSFAFCSTIEWHVQPALLGSGLLARQLAAESALGINCHHVYLNEVRMLQMLRQPFAEAVRSRFTIP